MRVVGQAYRRLAFAGVTVDRRLQDLPPLLLSLSQCPVGDEERVRLPLGQDRLAQIIQKVNIAPVGVVNNDLPKAVAGDLVADVHQELKCKYRIDGNGKALLLLHQACLSSDEYSLVIPILAKNYQVLAMDFPAHGNSDVPDREFTVEDYAKNAVDFLNGLGIKKASIVGHHSGASVAVDIAVTYPDLVDKLILSGCPVYKAGVREARLRGEDPKYKGMKITEDGSYLIKVWETEKAKSQQNLPIWHRMTVSHLTVSARDQDLHHAIFRYDIEQRLPIIKSPTLIISGDKDVFYDMLGYTQSLIPQSKTRVIDGGYLRPALDQPDEFAEAILEFLRIRQA